MLFHMPKLGIQLQLSHFWARAGQKPFTFNLAGLASEPILAKAHWSWAKAKPSQAVATLAYPYPWPPGVTLTLAIH